MTTFVLLACELAVLYLVGRRVLAGIVARALAAGPLRRGLTWALVAPGIALHEVAHALVALLLGARVERFVPFRPRASRDGVVLGYVVHRGVRGGAPGRAAVGLAPLWLLPPLLYAVGCALVAGVAVGDDPARLLEAVWRSLPAAGSVAFVLVGLSASIGLLPSPSDHADLPHALVLVGLVAGVWLLLAGLPSEADADALLGTAGGVAGFAAQLLAVPTAVALGGAALGLAR